MAKIRDIELGEFPLLLAPMEDVSDPPFRKICKELGADVVYTEFISSEGLIRNAAKSTKKLDIYDKERPVGIQIYGNDLNAMLRTIEIVVESKPDFIDLNFGCPVHKIATRGAGAGMLRDIDFMVKLTDALVKHSPLPVTVKTRLGWDSQTIVIEEVAERLQDIGIAALSIHGRTRVQMYKGEADWKPIAAVKNNPRIHIPIFGNGDVNSPEKAKLMRDEFGLDGAMIGRASIGNPWFFQQVKHFLQTNQYLSPPSIAERVDVSIKHLEHAMLWKGEKVGLLETRRHYTGYFKGIPNFKEYRLKLVTAPTKEEVLIILEEILKVFQDS